MGHKGGIWGAVGRSGVPGAAPTALAARVPVTSRGRAPLSPFLSCSRPHPRFPAPSLAPSLQRGRAAGGRGIFFFFCRALSDSPVGLLKHLVSLSRRHYELININSLFWYLLLPGALAWDFIYLFLFYSPSPPKMETDGSRLCLGESWGRPHGWGTMGSLSPSFRAGGIGAGERFLR